MKLDEEEMADIGFILNSALSFMNEKERRVFLGKVADYIGYGGVSLVSRFTGVARATIIAGIKEISGDEKAQ